MSDLSIKLKVENGFLAVELCEVSDTGWEYVVISSDSIALSDILQQMVLEPVAPADTQK